MRALSVYYSFCLCIQFAFIFRLETLEREYEDEEMDARLGAYDNFRFSFSRLRCVIVRMCSCVDVLCLFCFVIFAYIFCWSAFINDWLFCLLLLLCGRKKTPHHL